MPDSETFRLSGRVRYREVGGDGVLVQLDSGRVIVVNEVGLHLVELLGQAMTRQALVGALVDQYDVEAARAAVDLDQYLEELSREQLLEESRIDRVWP